ncbi:MAG: hypothetical protein LBV12_05005, partial [Puniceicoccales bacterium]|nr:hypothetical protein [Puniceicoccales bacterium]
MRKLLAYVAFILSPAICPVLTSFVYLNSAVVGAAQEKNSKRSGPQIGSDGVEGLEFLDFDKEGFLRWRLKGAEVRPERQNSVGFGENEVWILKEVSLQNYSKDTLVATIKSPSCRYSQRENKASGQEQLSMNGKFFDAVGKVWDWSGAGEINTIRIQQDVRVTLQPAGELKSPIHIFSTQLEARFQKEGADGSGRTEFIFSGKVKVLMEDKDKNPIAMESQSLVVRLNIGVGQMNSFAATVETTPKNSPSGNPIEVVESITATGDVHITSQGRHMY